MRNCKFIQKVAVVSNTSAVHFMVDNEILSLEDVPDRFFKGDIINLAGHNFKIVDVKIGIRFIDNKFVNTYEYGVLSNDKNTINIVYDDDKLKKTHPLLYKLMFEKLSDEERKTLLKSVKVPYTAKEWIDIINEIEGEVVYYIHNVNGTVCCK